MVGSCGCGCDGAIWPLLIVVVVVVVVVVVLCAEIINMLCH